jgi:hypothetical protein
MTAPHILNPAQAERVVGQGALSVQINDLGTSQAPVLVLPNGGPADTSAS